MHEADVTFLKRVFPLFPTTIVVSLAVFGHLFAPFCLDGLFASSPVWFWINYQVVFYPFIVLWPASAGTPRYGNDFPFTQLTFALLALGLSLFISLVEVGAALASDSKSVGWAAGYSLHVLTLLLLVLYHRHERRKEMDEIDHDVGQFGSSLALVVTSISVVFSLLSSWDYDTTRNNFFQSVVIYLLLPMQGIVLLCLDRRRNVRFSHAYLVFYSVLGMRIPDFLAFGSVRLFASLGGTSYWTSSSDALRYVVSVGYLMFMALYLRLLKRITESMSAPNTFPRFLFHAQFYCYSCYYVLVSTARRLDALFFFMLIVMNVYYVLNNTGTLSDWMDKYIWSRCESGRGDNGTDGWTAGQGITASGIKRSRSARSIGDDDGLSGALADRNRLIDLAYRIKLAEQDVLADSAALLAIPTLITVFASLAARDALRVADALSSATGPNVEIVSIRVEHYDGAPLDLANLWIRFGIMFLARAISSYASKRVFSCRIRSSVFFRSYLLGSNDIHELGGGGLGRVKSHRQESGIDAVEEGEEMLPLRESAQAHPKQLSGSGKDASSSAPHLLASEAAEFFTDASLRKVFLGLPNELTSPTAGMRQDIAASVDQFQSAVLAVEFPNVLPYFILVAIHSLYSLFQNPDLPTRYAFCSTTSLQE